MPRTRCCRRSGWARTSRCATQAHCALAWPKPATWWRRSAPTRRRCARSPTRSCAWRPSTTSTSAAVGCARHSMPSVLGVGCGQPDGSAEILLKAALMAAEERGSVELVRLDDVRIPEDADWFWEKLVECDGLIVSA